MDLSEIKCLLLDLDGTVYIEGELIGDMAATLQKVRKSGRKIIYLTNNSSKTAADYVKKLRKLGIFEDDDGVYTSGDATVNYLKINYPDKKVYLVGTDALCREFKESGVKLSEDADVLVLSYDTELTYEKLCIAVKLLKRGAPYIATHPDVNCPAKDVDLPDAGSFIELLAASSGRRPDVIIGKPHKFMADGVADRTGLNKSQIMMVGDRLYTDIKFGVNGGFKTLLVLSGETDAVVYEKSEIRADYVLNSLNDIVKFL